MKPWPQAGRQTLPIGLRTSLLLQVAARPQGERELPVWSAPGTRSAIRPQYK